ncbi:MAG: PQQ-binding-like beta-propeller repeat protein [Lysobacterales bacterium]|jgi:alcohol dehydrogenase (cytochrome c)
MHRLMLLLLPLLAATHAAAADSLFTGAQARSGKAVYAAHCANCHGLELEGGTAPALKGAQFAKNWSRADRSLDSLYYILRTTMPRDAGGSLEDDEYVDLVAYLLQANGYEPGNHALTSDGGAMAKVHLDGFASVAGGAAEPAPAFIVGEGGPQPHAKGPTQKQLLAAAGNTRDWLYQTHDYSGRRFVDLDQINRGNVARLQPVCMYQLGGAHAFQSNPIVYNGVLYVTTYRLTDAIDARTCRRLWRYTWQPKDSEPWANNRGVAIKDGRVFRGTSDGYLLALGAGDGRLLWARHVADPALGETFTMAPLAYDDLVVIGPAGSENNASGWVAAFRADDGREVWRFKTVPGARDPSAHESWSNPANIPLGGGAVWTPLSFDPENGELYVAVTNPAPDLPAHLRPGNNLYTNSVVALDIRTGALRWYRQLIANDAHDWDVTQVSPLFDLKIDGKERALLASAGKDGFLRVIDRRTHETLWKTPVTTQKNMDLPLTKEGVLVCPGILGGVEWNGPAYDPHSRRLFVNAVDWCTTFSLTDDDIKYVPGQLYLGGKIKFADDARGWLTALDAATGEVEWRYHSERQMIAAVTATSGKVVFTGELTGDFIALDADTGKVLYRFNTGGPIGGGIVTYALDGRQYVATVSGSASGLFESAGAPTVVLFALPPGGK